MKRENYLFFSFREWLHFLGKAITSLLRGLWQIIYAFVVGLLSVLNGLWQIVVRFVGRNPGIALGVFIFIVVVVWLLTFVGMRARAVGAEHQRDSISYELSKFTQMYDSTEYHESVIINGDTIRY